MKKKTVKMTILDKLPKNRKEYVKLLISLTKKNIKNNKSESDIMWKKQLVRLEKKLKSL